MAFFSRILEDIWTLITNVAINIGLAALSDDTDLVFTAILIGVVTLALMSGCWASSIAESRLHSPKLHFFAGLLAPLVYPLVILFTMRAGGFTPASAAESESDTPRKPWEAAGKAPTAPEPPEQEAEEAAEEDEDQFTPDYFRRIARDADGNFVGPWKITTETQEIIADRILEALPNVVVIETSSLGRQKQPQRLRVPYARILSCVRA